MKRLAVMLPLLLLSACGSEPAPAPPLAQTPVAPEPVVMQPVCGPHRAECAGGTSLRGTRAVDPSKTDMARAMRASRQARPCTALQGAEFDACMADAARRNGSP